MDPAGGGGGGPAGGGTIIEPVIVDPIDPAGGGGGTIIEPIIVDPIDPAGGRGGGPIDPPHGGHASVPSGPQVKVPHAGGGVMEPIDPINPRGGIEPIAPMDPAGGGGPAGGGTIIEPIIVDPIDP